MAGDLGTFLGGFAGSSIGSAVVNLVLDNDTYNTQLKTSEANLKVGAFKMGNLTAGLAAAGVAALATIGAAAVQFAVTSVSAALEAQDAQTKLANSIQNSASVSIGAIAAFDAQADALRRLTGADDEAVTGAQAFLVQMGLTQDQVTSLTPLIVDLATKQGIDLVTASKAVGKAVTGNVGSLTRLGIVVDDTRAKSDSYGATLEALGAVQGFAADKARDEPWRILAATFEEVQEQVGRELLPVLQELAEQLIPLAEDLGPLLAKTFEAIGEGALKASTGLHVLQGDIDALTKVNLEFFAQLLKVFPATKNFGEALEDANEIAKRYTELTKDSAGFTEVLTHAVGSGRDAMATWRLGLKSAANETQRFSKKTREAMAEFKKETRQTFTVADDVFESLADRSRVSADMIIKAFRRQIDALSNYQKNLEKARRRGVEEDTLEALSEMGLEGGIILAGLADATKREISKINEQFDTQTRKSGQVTNSLADLKFALDKIDGKKARATVEVHYTVSGVGIRELPGLGAAVGG